MNLTGTLRSWNDERGFGFIAPTQGGAELFVHIGAFPRDGSRPTVGELLSYELGRGREGKPQAVKVWRKAIGHPAAAPRSRRKQSPRSGSFLRVVAALVVTVVLAGYAYKSYQHSAAMASLAEPIPSTSPATPEPTFACDGRTHCSQMRSCKEAKFFLRNCPGTKMDGNHDGVPCEQQWCTSPLAD